MAAALLELDRSALLVVLLEHLLAGCQVDADLVVVEVNLRNQKTGRR